jgi:hypothetical protein
MPKELKEVDLDSDPNEGLTVTVNEDGTYQLEWDSGDPRWAMLNDLTADEIAAIITEYAKEITDDL